MGTFRRRERGGDTRGAADKMTRGTHQVGAFVAGLATLAYIAAITGPSGAASPVLKAIGLDPVAPPVSWPSLVGFLLAALLGGTAPDLDKPRQWWARFLAHTAFGGHRHLSHSLLGLGLFTACIGFITGAVGPSLNLSPTLLVIGFVAGYVSHLVLDSLTVEGVPWLFPVQAYVGFPPVGRLRVKTGGLVEQLVVMPLLLAAVAWIGYAAGSRLLTWWS